MEAFLEVAILIDGAFLRRKFHSAYKRDITACEVEKIAEKLLCKLSLSLSDSHRVYFYDCRPCGEEVKLKITKKTFAFSSTSQYSKGMKLLDGIRSLPYFAVREGQLSFNGWMPKENCYGNAEFSDDDFIPNLKQKGVDIKIGLDIAWISYNNIAENIILVTGDSDFIPALKVARRSGVFVHLFTLAHVVKSDLKVNADVCHEENIKNLLSTSC